MLAKRSIIVVAGLLAAVASFVFIVVDRHQQRKHHHLDAGRVVPTLNKTGYRFVFQERGASHAGITRFIGTAYSQNNVPLRFAVFVADGSKAPHISPSVIGVTKRLNSFQSSIRNVTILTEQGDGAESYNAKEVDTRAQMAADIESKVFRLVTKNPFFGGD